MAGRRSARVRRLCSAIVVWLCIALVATGLAVLSGPATPADAQAAPKFPNPLLIDTGGDRPAVSGDGRHVVFGTTSDAEDVQCVLYNASPPDGNFYVHTAAGGPPTKLTPSTPGNEPFSSADRSSMDYDGTHVAGSYTNVSFNCGPIDEGAGPCYHQTDPENYYCPWAQLYFWTRNGAGAYSAQLVSTRHSGQPPWWGSTGWSGPVPAGMGDYRMAPQLSLNPSVATTKSGGASQTRVAFQSEAEDLVATDGNDRSDIFIRDMGPSPSATVKVTSLSGADAFDPVIATDSMTVAFSVGDLHDDVDTKVFVQGLDYADGGGTVGGPVEVSKNSAGQPAVNTVGGKVHSLLPSISHDGRFVTFSSDATNLVGGVNDGKYHVYVHDRGYGATRDQYIGSWQEGYARTFLAWSWGAGGQLGTDGPWPSAVRVWDNPDTPPGDLHYSVVAAGKSSKASVPSQLMTHEFYPSLPNPAGLMEHNFEFGTSNGGVTDRISVDALAGVVAFHDSSPASAAVPSGGVFVWGSGPHGLGPGGPYNYSSDPVNVGNGNFVQQSTDLPGADGVFGADVSRTYNSGGSRAGSFGPGWVTPYDTHLGLWDDGTVMLHGPGGEELRYARGTQQGTFITPPATTATLSESGGVYTLTALDGSTSTFDSDGLLTGMADGQGQSVSITRMANGLPDVVTTSPSGYSVDFEPAAQDTQWPENPDNFVVGSATSSDGREVNYLYGNDGEGQGGMRTLAAASRVHGQDEQDYDATHNPAYGWTLYETDGASITKITETLAYGDPAWAANDIDGIGRDIKVRRVIENTYDSWRRVATQINETGDLITFHYDTSFDYNTLQFVSDESTRGLTTVHNDASGDVTVYAQNGALYGVGTTDANGNPTARSFTDGLIDETTDRAGATYKSAYDDQRRPIGQIQPDPDTGQLPAGITQNPATWGSRYSQTTYISDTDNRVATSRDLAGVITSYTYGDANNPLLPTVVATTCDPASLDTAASSGMISACQNTASIDQQDCDEGTASGATCIWYEAGPDLKGLVKKTSDPDGVITDTAYYGSGPDKRKVHTVTVHPNGSGTNPHLTTTYTYARPGDPDWSEAAGIGLVSTVTSPLGNASKTKYDFAGRPVATVNPLGHATATVFFHTGEVLASTDEANATTTHASRYSGDPDWGTQPAAIAKLAATTDPAGHVSIECFDRTGDLVTTIAAATVASCDPAVSGGAVSTYQYGRLGRLELATAPPRNKTGDSLGNAGVQSRYHYDDNGNLTRTVTGPTDNDEAHTTTTLYNKAGQITDTYGPTGDIDPFGTAVTRTHTRFGYDIAGRKIWQLEGADAPDGDPAKLLTGYKYDAAGKLYQTIVQNRHYYNTAAPFDLDLSNSDSTGSPIVSESRFSLAGRAVQAIEPPVDDLDFRWGDTSPAKRIIRSGYDLAGRRTTLTNAMGKTTTTTFDADGRVDTITAPLAGATTYITDYSYDNAGRVTGITTPSGMASPATVTVDRTYDPRGMVTSETDPYAGAPTGTRYFQHDEAGQLDKVTDANGNDVFYDYDNAGRRSRRYVKNPGDPDPCDPLAQTPVIAGCVIEDWVYDPAGHLIRQTLGHNDTQLDPYQVPGTSYAFDVYGRLANIDDASGRHVTRGYFNTGALKTDIYTQGTENPASVNCTSADPTTIVGYCYRADARGRVTATRDVTERTGGPGAGGVDGMITTAYNQTGQALQITDANGTATYQWDQAGNLREMEYPDGIDFLFMHNANNRLTITGLPSGSGIWPLANYALNDTGAPTYEALNLFGLSGNRQYVRDPANHVTGFAESITKPGTPTTYDLHYGTLAYRNDGRLATECAGPTQLSGSTYQQRQAACLGTLPQDVQRSSYGYDSAGQLCTATNNATPLACGTTQGATHGYGYDSRGNRTSHYDGTNTTLYTYNTSSELCAATTHTNPMSCGAQPPTGATTTTYTYDEMGRRTSDVTSDGTTNTRTVARTYDAAGRTTRTNIADTTLGTKQECRYHTAAGRVGTYAEDTTDCGEATPDSTSTLTWSDVNGIPQLVDGHTNGTLWTRLNYGRERYGVDVVGYGAKWYKYDAHNSTTKPADGNTNSPDAPTGYEPYGKPTDPAFNDNKGFFGYRGELHLDGLIHLRNRDYDPTTGTFTTRDPVGEPDGTTVTANPYAYGRNDPLNLTDPLGLRAQDCRLRLNDECVPTGIEDDPKNVKDLAVFGNVNTATHVAIYVPATQQNRTNFRVYGQQLYEQAQKLGYSNLAVIAWLGLVPPQNSEIVGAPIPDGDFLTHPARHDVETMSDMSRYLSEHSKTVTLLGLSWASQFVTEAVRFFDARPRNVILLGPYGVNASSASQYNGATVWFACNEGDVICSAMSGYTGHDAKVIKTDQVGSHFYFQTDSITLKNSAAISSGRYCDVVLADDSRGC